MYYGRPLKVKFRELNPSNRGIRFSSRGRPRFFTPNFRANRGGGRVLRNNRLFGHHLDSPLHDGTNRLPSPPPEADGPHLPSESSTSPKWQNLVPRCDISQPSSDGHADVSSHSREGSHPWSQDTRTSSLTPPLSSIGPSASVVEGQQAANTHPPPGWMFPYPVPYMLPYNGTYPVPMPSNVQALASPPNSDNGAQHPPSAPSFNWLPSGAAYVVSVRL